MNVKVVEGFPVTFLQKAASILADTDGGLSGSKIVNFFSSYAEKWDASLPFPEYPAGARRKDEILRENLKSFNSPQQFLILSELCNLKVYGRNIRPRVEELKLDLYTKYGDLRPEVDTKELDLPLMHETRDWLERYPKSLKLFNESKLKYDHGVFERNLLDDLRLAFELLLKEIVSKTSLEKQPKYLGPYFKSHGTSPQVNTMFKELIRFYTDYQNDFVKHNDKVKKEEIKLMFELTASLMKYIIQISS